MGTKNKILKSVQDLKYALFREHLFNEFWGEVENIDWKKISRKIKKLFKRNKDNDNE